MMNRLRHQDDTIAKGGIVNLHHVGEDVPEAERAQRIAWLRERLAARGKRAAEELEERQFAALYSGNRDPIPTNKNGGLSRMGQARLSAALMFRKGQIPVSELQRIVGRLDKVPDDILSLVADQIREEYPEDQPAPGFKIVALKCTAAMLMTNEFAKLNQSPPKKPFRRVIL
jgi:hypothetical protein